jgi:hypothetical protein
VIDRLRRFFLEPQGAEVALEFSSAAIVGARVETRGGKTGLRAVAAETLNEGTLRPSLEDPGFAVKEELRYAVKGVLARIGASPGMRAALVVPDVVARFRLFPQDEVKAEPRKRDGLLAFRMQKLLPFPAGEARVISAWPRRAQDPVLAVGFSAPVLSAYEHVGEAYGLDIGSVETSSMALLRGIHVEGDALVIRHDPTWLTLTVVRNGWPVSIRSFDQAVAKNPEEVRREIASTAVFWRDRLLGSKLEGAFIHASDRSFEQLRDDIAFRFECRVERAKPPGHLVVAGLPNATLASATPTLALLGASS